MGESTEAAAKRLALRRRRFRLGHYSELIASAFLLAMGYRILARRWKTRRGEIDIVAVRRRRLTFVEVKLRRTMADAEAAITPRLRQRVRHGAEHWLARHPGFRHYDVGFDLVLLVPWHWPRHIENGL